ncbi:hypothetical protein ACP6L2_05580 [Sphingobacterium lactis]|uniref:hypothetical protein n=1 Tax=Sphingobacterium lactis TaxID=797291 RepID=UPI003F7D7A2F
MNIDDKIIESSIRYGKPIITDEIIEYYRKNPKELDSIINHSSFQTKFLKYFFVLGLSLTVGVRLMRYFFDDNAFGEFIDRVILDVISEIGIAIFGGALTVYFLEFLRKKHFQESIQFRRELIKRIAEVEKGEAGNKS